MRPWRVSSSASGSKEGFDKRYPAQLSGGQQQRVALARMLAARPGILMLDEPFSALDAHLKSVLEQNLVSLFDAFDGTILYVSHDIDEALRFCDPHRCGGGWPRHGDRHGVTPPVNNPQSQAGNKRSGVQKRDAGRNTWTPITCAYRVGASPWRLPARCRDVKCLKLRAFYLRAGH